MHEQAIARRYYISGMVQGVGYRYFAKRAASKLQLTGYVRNLRDGRVEVYAVGAAASMIALRKDLERGPHGASVSNVTEEKPLMIRSSREPSQLNTKADSRKRKRWTI